MSATAVLQVILLFLLIFMAVGAAVAMLYFALQAEPIGALLCAMSAIVCMWIAAQLSGT